MDYKIFNNIGGERDMTDEEITAFNNGKRNASEKLEDIRQLRNEKLSETDYLAMSDNTMSDEMKAFRKSMRDIPQNYSSDKYDELLARNDKGELTHSVWSKP